MSTHANRGRILERAIGRASRAYERDNRCELRKQETPLATRDGLLFHNAKAPIDFRGTMAGGRAVAIEAKLVTEGTSLDLEKWPPKQQDALGKQFALGAWTRLVVAFDQHGETFACDWPALDEFLKKPWRASLSLYWFRAYAELIEDGPRTDMQERRCWFLDGKPHPHQGAAMGTVIAEMNRAARAQPRPPRPAPPMVDAKAFNAMSPDERRKHLFESMDQGLRRAARQRGRRAPWGGG